MRLKQKKLKKRKVNSLTKMLLQIQILDGAEKGTSSATTISTYSLNNIKKN